MRVANRLVWILSLAIFLTACASAPPPVPKPAAQSIVPGTPDEVAGALLQEMTHRQFTLTSRNAGMLTFDRPIDNAALWPKLDGAPGNLPRAHVVMTLTPIGRNTRVAVDLVIIASPGKAQERVIEASALGVDPRMDDILIDAAATVVAEHGTSDPRTAFAVQPINY